MPDETKPIPQPPTNPTPITTEAKETPKEELKKAPVILQKPYSFNTTAFNNKLVALAKARDDKAGKPNYNPFLWFTTIVQPLVDRFKKGEQTKELFDSFMSISETVPCLDPNWTAPVEETRRIVPPGGPKR